MLSRKSSNTAGSPVLLKHILLIFMIVISALSCTTQDKQETAGGLNGTVSGSSNSGGENHAAGDGSLKDAGTRDFSDDEFAGTYKLTGDPICGITLIIKKDSDGFLYTFNGTITGSGRIGLDKKEGQIHVYFNGIRCGVDNDSVIGVYSYKTILIQRYGSSKGNTACFRECDSKILRFVKN